MSRIGIGSNIIQPDNRCLNCKYWKSARRLGIANFIESGHCTAGYCKKDFIQKHNKRRK